MSLGTFVKNEMQLKQFVPWSQTGNHTNLWWNYV